MTFQKRYTGEFLSIDGKRWRCDIWQKVETAFAVQELTFAADPLTIEWKEAAKHEVLCSSCATLRIESTSDRKFVDLYTVDPLGVRLDVYAEGSLYWSGCLDPETYEEPYSRLKGYDVTLTFSDFGVLDRLPCQTPTMMTVESAISKAVTASGINFARIDSSLVSGRVGDASVLTALSVRGDNFIDEDGEYSTMKEALEGVLQPLGVKVMQKAGVVHVFDLNGLYGSEESEEIYWTSDNAALGVDSVYNAVNVNFSPYAQPELMSGDYEYTSPYDASLYNWLPTAPATPGYYEYYTYNESELTISPYDFTMFVGGGAEGAVDQATLSGVSNFKIVPVYGSEESAGLVYGYYSGNPKANGGDAAKLTMPVRACDPTKTLFSTKKYYLPAMGDSAGKFLLRLTAEICADPRYNPFSGATENNEEGAYDTFTEYSTFVFIPAKVEIYDDSGNCLCHYKNKSMAENSDTLLWYLSQTYGEWVSGADPGGDCWLEYYPLDDLNHSTAMGGWAKNRPAIGRTNYRGSGGRLAAISPTLAKLDPGQYMLYPPAGGWVKVSICEGIDGYDYDEEDNLPWRSSSMAWTRKGVRASLRWMMYKAPVLEILNNNLVYASTGMDDVEYSGVLNEQAKESLDIDTVCGTPETVSPSPRGQYFLSASKTPASEITRAGRTAIPEELLIGTLYSQHAERHTRLTGEARSLYALRPLTEANQGSLKFMAVAESQDCRMGASECVFIELSPDEYEKI